MRMVVQDIVAYLKTGVAGETLRSAEEQFGAHDLRLFCFRLWSWWQRGTLMVSRHPYLQHGRFQPMHRFREFVAAVPELSDLVCLDDESCRFAEHVSRDEWQTINEYTRAHIQPRLMT